MSGRQGLVEKVHGFCTPTDRDIREIAGSTGSLAAALRSMVTDHWTLAEMRTEVLDTFESGLRTGAQAADRRSTRVSSIDYRELVRDPLGMMRRVYELFGLPWKEIVEPPMRAGLLANLAKRGREQSDLTDSGLASDQVTAACPVFVEVARSFWPT